MREKHEAEITAHHIAYFLDMDKSSAVLAFMHVALFGLWIGSSQVRDAARDPTAPRARRARSIVRASYTSERARALAGAHPDPGEPHRDHDDHHL